MISNRVSMIEQEAGVSIHPGKNNGFSLKNDLIFIQAHDGDSENFQRFSLETTDQNHMMQDSDNLPPQQRNSVDLSESDNRDKWQNQKATVDYSDISNEYQVISHSDS